MAALEYSNAALNVRAAFFGASKMLYVEGDDDVIFWEAVLRAFGKQGFKVEGVGGIEELKKKINKIRANEINSVAASDADFSKLSQSSVPIRNVMVTYGHSIENSLINPRSLHQIAKIYGRIPEGKISEHELAEWLNDLEGHFIDLVLYDAANQIHGLGHAVLSNHCTQFMTGQQSSSPSANKIAEAVRHHSSDTLLHGHMVAVKAVFSATGNRGLDYMRGHFLANAAMKKVNRMIAGNGASKSVNKDSFTSSLMVGFSQMFDSSHPHYEHYMSEVSRV